MDAVAILEKLGPLATQFGWPAVFFALALPRLFALAKAHVDLMETLRAELPRMRRYQRVGIKAARAQTKATREQTSATAALSQTIHDLGARVAPPTPAV